MARLSIGIVGLPNVGKSTLFNAITNASVEAANYPFCTIEPNSGIVCVPDARLNQLAQISESEKVIASTIEFVDIAGLVKGASKGEGLGNQFLSNIRETSAIAHVVRCFEDSNVSHVHGQINPIDDIEIINTELILADLSTVTKLIDNQSRKAKAGDKAEKLKLELLTQLKTTLEAGNPVRQCELSEEDWTVLKEFHFLTQKKVIYVANISDDMIGSDSELVNKVKAYAAEQGDEFLWLCAKIESELTELSDDEREEMIRDLGLEMSGLDKLAQACFNLLNLQCYLTTGPKETRSWTIRVGTKAPQAAGEIHTDFEHGFIRANILSFDDFIANSGWKNAKDKGLIRQEGKDYVMKDGDVVEFLFNK